MGSRTRGTNRDSFDSRDLIYRPALLDLPKVRYPQWRSIVVLDQGEEGACTGFGLAAVVNYLRAVRQEQATVSARMLFEMAKRYDQWPGNRYDWSSARGAMKGWYKHGVCSERTWPNAASDDTELTNDRAVDALQCPLGAYYRVLPRRLDVHAALTEVGVVFAAAATHAGWDRPDADGVIRRPDEDVSMGHAFAIVGYDERGFLVQNSWGPDWGGVRADGRRRKGLAIWTYDDFECNVWDVWVARTALPVESLEALRSTYTLGNSGSRRTESGPPPLEVARHLIHVDDGAFDDRSDYPSTEASARELVQSKIDAASTQEAPCLMLYAHGGLNTLDDVARRVRAWRDVIDANGVQHLHWMWETGFLAELKDVLLGKDEFAKQRAGGARDWVDKLLEKLTRPLGKALWNEMKRDANRAFGTDGAGVQVLRMFGEALAGKPQPRPPRITLVGHSAGALWMGEQLEGWARLEPSFRVDHVVLMAPACTVEFFERCIAPHVLAGRVDHLTLFQLTDALERDDNVAKVYGKSLLYYVSNACEGSEGGTPLLGMATYNPLWATLRQRMQDEGRLSLLTATIDQDTSRATTHGGFDNDVHTLNTILRLARGAAPLRPFEPDDVRGY